jgi:AP-2 complex subunit mu-1
LTLVRIRRFPGEAEYQLSAEVELSARLEDKKPWSRPPIAMEFQVLLMFLSHLLFKVPMFTASGLHVRFLKIFEKSNYNTVKWVRYITKNGSYQNRI